ncbi:MAG: hypothetical protein KY461_06705 [Actinobacteria bacterium]|nr:hypothetical protein [Actinomycetota bacterium]
MRRPTRTSLAAIATAGFALAGVACGPGATETEADQPVVVDPNEEVGETLLPETPSEVEGDEG